MSSLRDPLVVLRSLDPAPDPVDPRGPRARAALERILAADPRAGARPARRRVSAPRLAAAGTAVAALAAAAVVMPSLTASDRAFASWTAEPTRVDAQEAAGMSDACRDARRDGTDPSYAKLLGAATPAVAERRGEWSLVLLAGARGFSTLCITDESRPFFRSNFGYLAGPGGVAEPGPRTVAPVTLGVGSIDGNELSVAAGKVGSNVTAVSFDSARHGRVSATVSHGHFALWFPGDELEEGPSDGTPVEVTYRSGATETVMLALD